MLNALSIFAQKFHEPAGLYAMLYVLLKAEDYSLLGGSLLLFGLLAVVMIATRRIDWYALTSARSAPATAS